LISDTYTHITLHVIQEERRHFRIGW